MTDPAPLSDTVSTVWSSIVQAYRDRDFIVSVAPDGSIDRATYGEVDTRSEKLTSLLVSIGVTKGTRVGLLLPNGVDFAASFLAATRVGAVAVPINTFFQAQEVAWLLRDADIHTIVTVPTIVGKSMLDRLEVALPGLGAAKDPQLAVLTVPNVRRIVSLGDERRSWLTPLSQATSDTRLIDAMEEVVRPADDCFVLYTSGSTSTPKGAIHLHAPTLNHSGFIAREHKFTSDDRIYVPMGFFWIGGLIYGLLGPMQVGATVLTEQKFDAGLVLRMLQDERATYTTGWPHVGPALSNHPDFATTDLSSLRGGYQQTLLPEHLRDPDPALRAVTLGMTETCTSHTWWPPDVPLPSSKRGSLGIASPGFEHRVIDDTGTDVPDGERGEVLVRGYAMMRGIAGRARADVFDADGWYHTGDAVQRDADGFFYFAGRVDDLIKTSGANVSPMEVEEVLKSFPGIREVYVIGVPDPTKGAVVAAVVVSNRDIALDADALRQWCKDRLAAYKVPKTWVLLDSPDLLPYTTTNKIDRRRLIAEFDNLPVRS